MRGLVVLTRISIRRRAFFRYLSPVSWLPDPRVEEPKAGQKEGGILGFALEVLQECSDGEDLDRFDSMKAQEVIVAADEPADAGGDCTGDEFGVVRVSDFWDDRWRHFDGLDEGEKFFFDQASYLGVRQFEFLIGQHSNVFIKNWGRDDGSEPAGLPGRDELRRWPRK